MAEKKNMFEQAAVKRQQEQKTIEAAVLGKPAQKDTWRARKRGCSISDLLHQWTTEAYEA